MTSAFPPQALALSPQMWAIPGARTVSSSEAEEKHKKGFWTHIDYTLTDLAERGANNWGCGWTFKDKGHIPGITGVWRKENWYLAQTGENSKKEVRLSGMSQTGLGKRECGEGSRWREEPGRRYEGRSYEQVGGSSQRASHPSHSWQAVMTWAWLIKHIWKLGELLDLVKNYMVHLIRPPLRNKCH